MAEPAQERIEELEEAIREALDEIENWLDGNDENIADIMTRLEGALINDDTIITLAAPRNEDS